MAGLRSVGWICWRFGGGLCRLGVRLGGGWLDDGILCGDSWRRLFFAAILGEASFWLRRLFAATVLGGGYSGRQLFGAADILVAAAILGGGYSGRHFEADFAFISIDSLVNTFISSVVILSHLQLFCSSC